MITIEHPIRKELTISSYFSQANWAPLPPYSTLLNDKLIIPSSTTPYFAVEQHFLFNLMRIFILRIDVDEDWYISRYPDIREALAQGKVESVKEHYSRFGFYEHRMPYAMTVDVPWYLDSYPDVSESVRKRDFISAESHFELVGYKEGRLPFAGFQLKLVK